jgi:hypothetical protein
MLISTAMTLELYQVWPIRYMSIFNIQQPEDSVPLDSLSNRISNITTSFGVQVGPTCRWTEIYISIYKYVFQQ